MTLRHWTTAELATLRRMAPDHDAETIGATLGRTRCAVHNAALYHKVRLAKRGEKHHAAKHSDALVRSVRDMAARDVSLTKIARGTNLPLSVVAMVAQGKRRKEAA